MSCFPIKLHSGGADDGEVTHLTFFTSSGCRNCRRGGDGESLPAGVDADKQGITVKVGVTNPIVKELFLLTFACVTANAFSQARRRHAGVPARVCI